jgi:hypothetical protein
MNARRTAQFDPVCGASASSDNRQRGLADAQTAGPIFDISPSTLK